VLRSLHIIGYRSFREIRVDPLTRVNLFVGTNNAGKSSILDAAELLATGTATSLFRSVIRREERMLINRQERRPGEQFEWDLSHLFHGHELKIGNSFRILGDSQLELECYVTTELLDEERQRAVPTLISSDVVAGIQLMSNVEQRFLAISSDGGFSDSLRRRAIAPSPPEEGPRVTFLGTDTSDLYRLGQLWDAVVLTPEEEGIVSALRIVDPSVERIAFLGDLRGARGILLKAEGSDRPFPLGTAGEGLKRLLALALHLFSARDGYLLVDEIDTGLHYSVMADMWRLVIETAKRLNVQVLATTHSLDCVRALAWVREKVRESDSEVILHRVERELSRTVSYSLDELTIAARNYLEVR
jgi:predicted ATPase